MIDNLVCFASAVVMVAACGMRINILYFRHDPFTVWGLLEVAGLALLMAASAGIGGELFLPNGDFQHLKAMFVGSCALTVVGISKGSLSSVVARLKGWDGSNRRAANEAEATDTSTTLQRRG